MKLLLAISSSSAEASAALVMPNSIVASKKLGGTSHSKTLMPAIDEMLNEYNVSLSDIDGIAVDIGPGSFTGVRIGVATANGLAFGANKPIIGVTSLLALRHSIPKYDVVAALIDAKHDSVYAAIYNKDSEIFPACATPIEELLHHIPSNCVCIGDGALAYKDKIHFAHPYVRFAIKDEEDNLCASNFPCAVSVAMAAFALYEKDKSCSLSQVEPTYFRPSQAERMRDIKAEAEEPEEPDEPEEQFE